MSPTPSLPEPSHTPSRPAELKGCGWATGVMQRAWAVLTSVQPGTHGNSF